MLDSIPPSVIREHHKITPKVLVPWKFSIILSSDDPFAGYLGSYGRANHMICRASATYNTLTWHKKPRHRSLRCRQGQHAEIRKVWVRSRRYWSSMDRCTVDSDTVSLDASVDGDFRSQENIEINAQGTRRDRTRSYGKHHPAVGGCMHVQAR
jgi:hypothetical protein